MYKESRISSGLPLNVESRKRASVLKRFNENHKNTGGDNVGEHPSEKPNRGKRS